MHAHALPCMTATLSIMYGRAVTAGREVAGCSPSYLPTGQPAIDRTASREVGGCSPSYVPYRPKSSMYGRAVTAGREVASCSPSYLPTGQLARHRSNGR
jgi:ferritin-like protein